jgi:hypothetical protein
MRVIDARSGQEMKPGHPISYEDGEQVTLLELVPGLTKASMLVRAKHRDRGTGRFVMATQWVDGPVRYLHPDFMFQRIVFFPS